MVPSGAFLSPLTGRRLPDRHEQKDGGLASDEGVAERFLALGMRPGRSPFKVQKEKLARNTGFYT